MTEASSAYTIGIPIYDQVDLLDVAAPCEIFSWMGYYWEQDPVARRSVKIDLIAATSETLRTRDGLILTPTATFADVITPLDLLWVPGGSPDGLTAMMKDKTYLGFLKQQSGAGYVGSVCEGALLLATAGLLDGYEATTHWAFIPCLKSFPNIKVAEGNPRFVIDRNRVTGGGISSGIDEALELTARISSYNIAKNVQAITQYFPQPPFTGEIPPPGKCPLQM